MITIKSKQMGTFIVEQIVIVNQDKNIDDVSMYLNDEGDMYISNEAFDATNFYFTFSKEDWPEIKKFIDNQFST